MSTYSSERHAEAQWAASATVDTAQAEHNSGAHDGAPSRFCTHRQCVRATKTTR